jgi:tetratricopeptide (TPR) repeat protein
MSVFIERNRGGACRQWALCLALISILSSSLEVRSQDAARPNDLLLPPKPNLVSVHWPDLTKLEAAVREQLTSLQASLANTVKNNGSEATLGNAYGTMGEIYHAYSLNAPARECYLNATYLAPKAFRWVYLLGKLDEQEGRFDDAVRRYQIARGLLPDYAAVPVNLGNIYLQLNRLEDAKENFNAALAIDKSNAAALYGLGQIALAQRSYVPAVSYFEKALALIPAANRVHYSLAMAYRGLGNLEKAAAHLAQQGLVGVRVNDPLLDGLQDSIKGERIHLIRGKLALESRRYAEAADEFRKAIAANRDSISAHVNLGAVLVATGDLKGAAEQYEETLRIDPEYTNAHYNLAILLGREDKHEPAIVHLQAVLRVDPNDLSARFLLGRELLKANRQEEALAEFSRVVQADPDNEEATLEQVRLLQLKREYKQSLESLEKAHARNPQKGQTIVMLASLLAASPQYELRDGARALNLAQLVYKQTGALQHGALVAMALAELGRCNEAAEWQRKLIAAAEQEHKTDLLAKLRTSLKQYEKAQPCRPEGETTSLGNPE